MKRIFLFLAMVALLGSLPACRDAGGSDNVVSPTPTPTPVPTPAPGTSGSVDDGTSTIDNGGTAVTPDSGAAMVSSQETVTVTTVDSLDATTAAITVQRANGEVWSFDVIGAPTPTVGDKALFQSASLVFGDLTGTLLFPTLNSASFAVSDATRLQ